MQNKMTLGRAYDIIGPFVYIRKDSPGPVTEDVRSAARFLIEGSFKTPEEQNDVFCIAICCDLDMETKRRAAWNLVTNMLITKFSWFSDLNNYSLEKALCDASVIVKGEFEGSITSLCPVIFHTSDLPKRVIEKFNLPTSRLHSNKILNDKEKEERRHLNMQYPFHYTNTPRWVL